jgi:hypothetical protein
MLATMTNGEVSLTERMRLSLGRVEVEAYLAGIKYAMGSASRLFII